jgi:hypothetical protein
VALHPIEAEQLNHLLTEVEEHRRVLAILAHLLLEKVGLPPGASLVLSHEAVSHLGNCVSGAARLHVDRAGTIRLTVERGRY